MCCQPPLQGLHRVTANAYQTLLYQICCPGSLIHILIEIRFSSKAAISLAEKLLIAGKLQLYGCIHDPKIAGLRHLVHIAGNEQRYGSPKNGRSEANHLAIAGCQSKVMVQ
jgi:hypothetical protein